MIFKLMIRSLIKRLIKIHKNKYNNKLQTFLTSDLLSVSSNFLLLVVLFVFDRCCCTLAFIELIKLFDPIELMTFPPLLTEEVP